MPDNSREAELLTLLQARDGEVRRLKAEVTSFKAEVTLLKTENTLLRQKIDLLIKRLFGASSEPSGARKPKGGAFARRAAPEGAGKSWMPRNSSCCSGWRTRREKRPPPRNRGRPISHPARTHRAPRAPAGMNRAGRRTCQSLKKSSSPRR